MLFSKLSGRELKKSISVNCSIESTETTKSDNNPTPGVFSSKKETEEKAFYP